MTVNTEGHTFKRYDQEMAQLRNLVMEMGGLVENQINRAIEALDHEDLSIAREVVERDRAVNDLDVRVEEMFIHLIAMRQPMGSDLRMLMTLKDSVTDLERIGDEAKKVARMVLHIYDSDANPPSSRLFRDVYVMGRLASDMLRRSLDVLARQDYEGAVAIITHGDEDLNREFQAALRRLVTYMMEDPRTIGHAINVLFIVKALERIGDHAKNVAEYAVYLIKGKDVRHRAGREAALGLPAGDDANSG